MSSAAVQKPVRKFPPPCWTRDEALVLIEAYRERWYALHRAFLRTPDWDAVAEKLTTSCPHVNPPKTAAQCRHKMEKLRQRHRVEKQRASAFSGERFFSSWFYFEAMEAMENGYTIQPGSNDPMNSEIHNTSSIPSPSRPGIPFKPSSVQNLVTLAISSTKHGIKSSPNLSSRVSNLHPSNTNKRSNQEADEDSSLVETPIEETLMLTPYRGTEAKNHKSSSIGGAIRIQTLITQSGGSNHRARKFRKVVHGDDVDDNGEMWVKVPRSTNLFRGKYQNGNNSNSNSNSSSKKKNGGIAEVVSSIKLLGDGFMKMEKMKIDMAREMEKMRMETEMKRNQLILESQKQIVDAFLKGLIESRNGSFVASL